MTELDYSSMSDEQLAQMAGVSLSSPNSGLDYSSMSDQELAQKAGITLPSVGSQLLNTFSSGVKSGGSALLNSVESIPQGLENLGALPGNALNIAQDAGGLFRSKAAGFLNYNLGTQFDTNFFPVGTPDSTKIALAKAQAGQTLTPEEKQTALSGLATAQAGEANTYDQTDRTLRGVAKIGAGVATGGALSAAASPLIAAALASPAISASNLLVDKANQITGLDTNTTAPQDLNNFVYGTGQNLTGQVLTKGLGTAISAPGVISDLVSSKLEDSANSSLEKGLGIQYGDKLKGLNKSPVYLDDNGDVVPFDQAATAAKTQAPIQQGVQSLTDQGILKGLPNNADDAGKFLQGKRQDAGQTIQDLTDAAQKATQGQSIPVSFTEAQKYVDSFRSEMRVKLQPVLDGVIDDYKNNPGTGFQKLTDFTNRLQKEVKFDPVTPSETVQLKRLASYDLRSTSEQTFDTALPNQAGEFSNANQNYSTLKQLVGTINKRVAKDTPSLYDYLAGGSKQSSILGGASYLLTHNPAAVAATVVAGGIPSLVKGLSAKYPVSAYNIKEALSNKISKYIPSSAIKGAGNAISGLSSLAPVAISAGGGDRIPQPTTASTPVNRQQFNQAIAPIALPKETPPVKLTPIPSQLNNLSKDARIQKTADFVSSQPPLIQAIIKIESSGDPFAQSSTGPRGLMQLSGATGEYYGAKDRLDPRQNVEAGTKFIADLKTKYHDPYIILAAYNQGETVVNAAIKRAGESAKTADFNTIKKYLPTDEGKGYPKLVHDTMNKMFPNIAEV